MKLALVYDTETTGLPLWSDPSEDPRQPHIVQIGARLVDYDTLKSHAAIDLIVRPSGWDIPADMTYIHGITHAHAERVGVHEIDAVRMLSYLWQQATVRIGFNESFDARIMRIAFKRYADEFPHNMTDAWKEGPCECAMRRSSPILKLGKNPTLIQAHERLVGSPHPNPHNALGDVDATLRVLEKVREYEALPNG